MTETTERVATTGRSGLATMNVVELKRLASGLGITGATKMRKDDLVAAITARQVGSAPRTAPAAQPQRAAAPERADEADTAARERGTTTTGTDDTGDRTRAERDAGPATSGDEPRRDRADRPDRQPQQEGQAAPARQSRQDRPQRDRQPEQTQSDRQ
ncbi:MAG TPA: Rho termination factor N-terminal domain-containing protein, partial [Lapillicoccus sp.]